MKKILLFISFLLIIILSVTSCVNDNDENSSIAYFWPTSTPEEQGLNAAKINNGFSAAAEKGYIYGIVVIRHGKLAAEKYFNGRSAGSYQTVRSVSKSFLSALIGIAIDKGMICLDQKIKDFFPEYEDFNDQRIYDITIEQLITMRAGFKGDEEFYFTFYQSSDWVKTILYSTLDFTPGSKMQYSTAGSHLTAVILSKAVNMNLMEFGEKYLFGPAGITISDWRQDPQGNYFGGNDMEFTVSDMAALGYLYLNNGKFNGEQIIPEDWVNKSTVSYSGSSSGSWGSLSKYGYGYFWWTGEVSGHKIFTALGHGGQYVLCVPDLDMIIALQSNPNVDWDQADIQERGALDIIAGYFIPSAN